MFTQTSRPYSVRKQTKVTHIFGVVTESGGEVKIHKAADFNVKVVIHLHAQTDGSKEERKQPSLEKNNMLVSCKQT